MKEIREVPRGFICEAALGCLLSAQLHDLMQLKQENSYLTTIARQISPYILSIAKVKERLEPRCRHHVVFCLLPYHSRVFQTVACCNE